jgi:hypothetical protein
MGSVVDVGDSCLSVNVVGLEIEAATCRGEVTAVVAAVLLLLRFRRRMMDADVDCRQSLQTHHFASAVDCNLVDFDRNIVSCSA